MTRQERKEADRFLIQLWDAAVGTKGYDKKKFALIQTAIWTNPNVDRGKDKG